MAGLSLALLAHIVLLDHTTEHKTCGTTLAEVNAIFIKISVIKSHKLCMP